MAILTMRQISAYCYSAGFRGNALITATAIAMAESSGRTDVVNHLGCTGLFQIYVKVHIKSHPSWTTKAMKQPYNNAKAAYALSNGGKNWRPWEVYTKGTYRKYLPAARKAVQQTLAKKGASGTAETSYKSTPTPAGPTVAKALAIARSQIGTAERGNNRTKYHTDMGLEFGQPWCACFTSWVLWKAGFSKGELHRFLGPNFFLTYRDKERTGIWYYALKKGTVTKTPKPGYLVMFSFKHIGIVEKVLSDGRIQTIEGNTSSGSRGSQNNGGRVYRKVRKRSSIRGFIKIPYDSGPAGSSTQPDNTDVTGMNPDQSTTAPRPDIDAQGILNENGVWNTATAVEFAKFAKITLPIKSSVAYWKEFEKEAGFPVKYQDGELDNETIEYIQWLTEQKSINGVWNSTTIRGVQRHLNKVKREAAEEAARNKSGEVPPGTPVNTGSDAP